MDKKLLFVIVVLIYSLGVHVAQLVENIRIAENDGVSTVSKNIAILYIVLICLGAIGIGGAMFVIGKMMMK